MNSQKLKTDFFGFPIVTTLAELQQAKEEGHPNVKTKCPGCGNCLLSSTGTAHFFFEHGCMQHAQPAEPVTLSLSKGGEEESAIISHLIDDDL